MFHIYFLNFGIMKNIMQKSFYMWVTFLTLSQSYLTHAMSFGQAAVDPKIQWTPNTLDVAIQNIIWKLASFLTILALVYALYWGFNILTAGGEEDKVKKWKAILVRALLWLTVIWLSYSIVSWLVTLILPSA